MTLSLLAVLGVGLVDPAQPVIHANDAGFTRGDGCFEGCRMLTTPDGRSTIDNLPAHLARLARSAASLELDYDPSAWPELVELVCAAWTEPGEVAVKIVLSRGQPGRPATGLVTVSPLPADYPRQRREGLRVVPLTRGVSSEAYLEPWLLGGVKTLSYAVNLAAQREALRRGVDEPIFLSTDGRVLEAPTSSVVWAVGRTLHTPPPGRNGILASITQHVLFARAQQAGWQTSLTDAGIDDLHAADVVWLIGSVRGPVDVVDLDGRARPRRPGVDAEIRRLAGFPTSTAAQS